MTCIERSDSPSTSSDERSSNEPDGSGPVGLAAASKPAPVRFVELEGLRGIAALLVVLYHLPYWHVAIHRISLVNNGGLMVELFFVLSGFVICSAYRHRLSTPRQVVDFQILRFGRLYPVHIVFLGFFLCVEFSKAVLASRYGITSNNTQAFRENTWTAFIEQLFLVHPLGTGNAITFNGPAWSIGTEFYAYLVFALIASIIPKWLVQVAIVVFGVSLLMLMTNELPQFVWVFKCLSGFFLGCLVQILSIRQSNVRALPLLGIAMVIGVIFMATPHGALAELLVFPISALIIYAIATGPDGWVRRLLRSRPLAWLGRISYSLYMAHSAVIWTVSQVIRFGFSKPHALAETGRVDAVLSLPEALVAIAAVMGLTVLVGYLVFRYVEDPFREATRCWVARRDVKRSSWMPVGS